MPIMSVIKETTKKVKKAAVGSVEKAELPKLIDMLEAGVHFGHERSKKNPAMDKYIFMIRNRMTIIDLEKTQEKLDEAVKFLQEISKDPSAEIVFVGTKRQARDIVRKYAEAVDMPYVTKRWLGGTLTNFMTVLKSIEKLEELLGMSKADIDKMTKKEKAVRQKEIERLEEVLEGIKNLKKLPKALVVVGAYDEKLAVKEAKKINIPVIGITDTNANPSLVDYPVPANDDAIRSIEMVVGAMAKAIASARGKKLILKSEEDKEEKKVEEKSE